MTRIRLAAGVAADYRLAPAPVRPDSVMLSGSDNASNAIADQSRDLPTIGMGLGIICASPTNRSHSGRLSLGENC